MGGSGQFEPNDRDKALEVAWKSSPVSNVPTWKSPVLFIHGDDDRNVRFSQTVDLVRRIAARGVEYEELVIVDDTHHFMRHANQLRVNAAIAAYLEKNQKLIRQVKGAMTYPIVVMVVASIVVSILLLKVVPQREQRRSEKVGLRRAAKHAAHRATVARLAERPGDVIVHVDRAINAGLSGARVDAPRMKCTGDGRAGSARRRIRCVRPSLRSRN